jgi:hypothetical protein
LLDDKFLFDIILSVKMHFTKQFTAQTYGIAVFWGPSGFCRVVCIAHNSTLNYVLDLRARQASR